MPVPRIGFACLWDRANPEGTWSYTPWLLRAAMRQRTPVRDLGVRLTAPTDWALKLAHLRWRDCRLTSDWSQSALTDAYCHRAVNRAAIASQVDAVLEIQDLAIVDRPYFLYQDLSFDALLQQLDRQGPLPPGLAVARLPTGQLRRRRDRQLQVYERATGVIAMSQWLARSLVELSGVPAGKVHVVNPGRAAGGSAADTVGAGARIGGGRLPLTDRPRRRLLLVGKGFLGKGGDLVVAALAILRREVDPAITLTVAGPRGWPLPGPVPNGVNFLGVLPRSEVARLYRSHDLLVMPSRLEGFGMVFAEALAAGLPCIGRDAFAMPELIEPGVNGALVADDDPAGLAAMVAGILADDRLYARCRARAADVAEHFTWDRAAGQVVDIIANHPT